MNTLTEIHITTHSKDGKMRDMLTISTSPYENRFCKKMSENKDLICHSCYAFRLCNIRPSLRHALEKNSILGKRLLPKPQLPVFNSRWVRFNSFGELLNLLHYKNLIKIAFKNPNTMFSLWTKRQNLVQRVKQVPKNLILIYSFPELNPHDLKIPKKFHKGFAVFTSKEAKARGIEFNCQKKCVECLKCYSKNDTSLIFEKKK